MTHPNNETEARIDHVLHALRDTQPSPGLNARITDRIAERRLAITGSRTSSSSLFVVILNAVKDPRILFAEAPLYTLAAVSLAILAALSLTVFHSHRPTTTQSRISASVIQPQSSAQNPEAIAAHKPNTSTHFEGAGFQSRRTNNTANTVLAIEASSTRSQPTNFQPSATPTDPDTDPDTIALAETLAPSHPAPPMPLTQQELLTLAILRSGDKEEIAALNPVHREALFAQEQAAFHDFFASPTPHPRNNDRR